MIKRRLKFADTDLHRTSKLQSARKVRIYLRSLSSKFNTFKHKTLKKVFTFCFIQFQDTAFFFFLVDYNGIVQLEYVSSGKTINKGHYCEASRRLRDAVRRKRPTLHENGQWQLHHDNAAAHASYLVLQFLAKHSAGSATTIFTRHRSLWLFPIPRNKKKIFEREQNATRQLYSISEDVFK